MAVNTLSPFSFYGGKAKMAPLICDMLDYENTDIYIEPFGGACRVLLNKDRHEHEIYNDFGTGLYEFFDCMSRPDLSQKVISALYDITPSEEVFFAMRDYKVEHETELTEFMRQQFKRFVYVCSRKYRSKVWSRLRDKIAQKEYSHIIGISKAILEGGKDDIGLDGIGLDGIDIGDIVMDWEDRRQLRAHVRLYEEYWKLAGDRYREVYAMAEKSFEKIWEKQRKQGKVLAEDKERHKHIASHLAALQEIGEMTEEVHVSNGANTQMNGIDMAVATFSTYYMSRDGMGLDYSDHKCRSTGAYYRQLLKLEEVAERMENVDVKQMNALSLIKLFRMNTRVMMYLDPSYLSESDMEKDLGKGIYNCSFGVEEHERLLKLIRNAKAKILISNYDVDLYNKYLDEAHGWKKTVYMTTTGVGGRKNNTRAEILWQNY